MNNKLVKRYLIGGTTPMYHAILQQNTNKSVKLMPSTNIRNNNMESFITGLTKYKNDLMKEFNLSEEDYNMLTRVAQGISYNESKNGISPKYHLKGSDIGQAFISLVRGDQSGINEPSRGVTQIKYNYNNTDGLFTNHGISADDLWDNEKAGYATMLKLAYDYNKLKPNIISGKYIDAKSKNPLSVEAILLLNWNSPIHLIKHKEGNQYVDGGDASESYGYIYRGLLHMPARNNSQNNIEYFGPRMHP